MNQKLEEREEALKLAEELELKKNAAMEEAKAKHDQEQQNLDESEKEEFNEEQWQDE